MKKETKTLSISVMLLVAGITLIAGVYIYYFSGSSISSNPSNWGVLGDYIGGTLNPLISLITLFYLIRTYLAQKEELSESGRVAQATARVQLLKVLISESYERLSLYRGEMEGVTRAMNNPARLGYGMKFVGMDGKMYDDDGEQKKYRLDMADKIQKELKKIDKHLKEIEGFLN